ncbi:MAG: hypothetical protein WA888_01530 [Burkholderiaceae bacterium]
MVFETDADTVTHLPIHPTRTCPRHHAQNASLDRDGIDFTKAIRFFLSSQRKH